MRLSSELPGLAAERIRAPARKLPGIEFRRVDSAETLDDFRALGATPVSMCRSPGSPEVFDRGITRRSSIPSAGWGITAGNRWATAATVSAQGITGLYNVATIPEYRHRGFGEAITRHAIDAAIRETNSTRIVLQSTSDGLRLYQRMGFEPVTPHSGLQFGSVMLATHDPLPLAP